MTRNVTLLLAGGLMLSTAAACTSTQTVLKEPAHGPHYCYATLADVDCHVAELKDQSYRKVGHYEAPRVTEVTCLDLVFERICPRH